MRIIVIGAGVLGSRYAAALHQAGQDVTILARGERFQQIAAHGIILEAINTGERTVVQVPVVEELKPDDAYDLALVMVRSNKVNSVLPTLAANKYTSSVLFLGNNANGPTEMVDALGQERVLMGFAGAAGVREDEVIRYMQSKGNSTYAGELDGKLTPRFERIIEAFADTQFPVKMIDNIDAWLKTHAALILPLAYGLYMCAGDNYRMANTRDALVLSARGIREGLRTLTQLDYPIQPRIMSWLFGMPEPVVLTLMRLALSTKHAEIGLAGHANAARDEMQYLADSFWKLVLTSGETAPSLRSLYAYNNPNQPPITAGSRHLTVDWGKLWLSLGAVLVQLVLSILLIKFLFGKRNKSRRI